MLVPTPIPPPPLPTALERYAALAPLPTTTFDRVTSLAARLLQAPVVLIVLGDIRRPWFTGGVGLGCGPTDHLLAACAHALCPVEEQVEGGPDVAPAPSPGHAPGAPGEPHPHCLGGVPLRAPDGARIGGLCVLDHHPRAPLPAQEAASLTDLAALAVGELELRLKTLELEAEGRARAEANRRFQEDLTLSRLLRGIGDLTDLGLALEDLILRVAELTAPVLGLDWVGLTSVEGNRATTTPVWHSPLGAGYAHDADLLGGGEGWVWRAAEQTVPIFTGDHPGPSGDPPAVSARLGGDGPVSHVVTLVRLGGSPSWNARERWLVESMTRILRHSIGQPTPTGTRPGDREHLDLALEEAQRARRQAETLLELSQLLEGAEGVEQIAPFALAAVGRALGDGWQVLWRREGEVFRPLAVHGAPPESVRRRQQDGLPVSHYEGLGVLAGHRVFLNAEALSETAWRNGMRGTAAVPVLLRLPGQELVLGAYRSGPFEAWTAFERDLLITAGRILRAGAERHLRLQDLAAAAHTDPLTGLGNRRAFTAHLQAELGRAAGQGGRVGVLSLDLDGLKTVNDREGHLRGDALLVEFARALRANFRPEDQVYRLGGDEYALVSPGVGPGEQAALLARMEVAVSQVRLVGFPGAGASAGLACFPVDGEDLRALVEVSDARMYAVKLGKRSAGGGQR